MEIIKKCSRNIFSIVVIGFVIYALFFDPHSYLKLTQYRNQIDHLEEEIAAYQDSTKCYEALIKELQSDNSDLEKYAREKLLMKREGEDVYVIE